MDLDITKLQNMIDGFVAIINNAIAVLRQFIDGFKKELVLTTPDETFKVDL